MVVKVALVQMACSADSRQNLEYALASISDAAEAGANIVCLPELFRSQYFCQHEAAENFDLAEPIPGQTTEALCAAAAEHGVVIVGSVFERRAAGVYHNSAAVIDADGKLVGLYRKMHIPDDPLYYEKFYFTPGDTGFVVVQTKFGKIAPLICWDQWYPEAARIAALKGAELIVYPTAIGWHPAEKEKYGESQLDAWQTMQRSHAIANGVFVAAVNRVGIEAPLMEADDRPTAYDGLEFWGCSFVSDPAGVVIADTDGSAQLLLANCDLGQIEQVRRNWPFLRDRRIDSYSEINKRFSDDAGGDSRPLS